MQFVKIVNWLILQNLQILRDFFLNTLNLLLKIYESIIQQNQKRFYS